ncbi:TonB-dependent receptor [Pseudorhodoferax sp.]|uniref:TonB-dependent receptor n=1 Tax=Pseudorhodoferax sp. TaxID=1993553 RepID=UPI002DD67A94|nr:TonB-dependent receptor [Pseudorhodoferax sp.]
MHAALLCAPALAQTTLPEVRVLEQAERTGAQLRLPAQTASRTGLAIHDTPASVDGVSAEQLRERGDVGVAEAITRTVGLTSSASPGNGGLSFGSRGFVGVNSVGVAEDGLAAGVAAGTISYPADAWGYERIEVLRGPASLMYGSGTMGATINAVRKQPSRERSVELLLSGGTDSTGRIGLGATGPIGEVLSYRVDVYGQRSDGERALDGSRSGKFMGTLRIAPTRDLQIDLVADHSLQKPSRYWGTPSLNGRVVQALRGENYNTDESVIRYEEDRLRARLRWRANDTVTVRNELFHFKTDRRWRNIEAYDYDPAAGTVAREDYLEILHDLEQTGNRFGVDLALGQHQVAAGWEISKARFRNSSNSPYRGASVVSAVNPQHGGWISPDATLPRFDTELRQNAFYAEDAWKLSDRWVLLSGLRRDFYDFSRRELVAGTPFDKDMGGTSARLGLTYKLDARTSLYAQYSRGHDPVTTLLSLNLANRDFRLSEGRQVEVGVKQQLAGNLGEWTLAVYDIQKNDIVTRDASRPAISIQGGSQSSKGVELGGVLRANAALRFEGNVSYTDAQFDQLLEAGGDRAGKRPLGVARQTANLWAHWRIGAWQASAGTRYVGKRFANNANTTEVPAYTLFDAALHWQVNANTTLSLIGRNLADKFYTNATYGSQFLVGPGRQFEVAANLRF